MRLRFAFLLTYLGFWIAYFVVGRAMFLVYQWRFTRQLSPPEIVGVFMHGFRMDVSAAAYLTLVPSVLVALCVCVPRHVTRNLLAIAAAVTVVGATAIVVADIEIYRVWGIRLDADVRIYLNTPKEMLASTSSSPVLLLAGLMIGVSVVAWIILGRRVLSRVRAFEPGTNRTFGALGALSFFLIVPMRGGLQQIPLNQSSVYFSSSHFANQAAINPIWSFLNSIKHRSSMNENPYRYAQDSEALEIVDRLLAGSGSTRPVLRISRPNIVLIVWESLTAKVIGQLGGVRGATPVLDRLIPEGLLFNSFYASGNRSEEGMVALLSGFPAQPRRSIARDYRKAAKLSLLSSDLKRAGYHTAFYHGGELEFANLKSYLLKGDFDRLIGKDAFDARDRTSKWGVPDHVLYRRVLQDYHGVAGPFFTIMFTLSSHEPFDVPTARASSGSEESLFLDAHRYSNESLGEFVRLARQESWWRDTLLVITADHGHRLPVSERRVPAGSPDNYHIPMLWLGGALDIRGKVITELGSQTDLPATLLDQLELPTNDYPWSRDLLMGRGQHFAYYAFNDGFGFVEEPGTLVFDNVGHNVIYEQGTPGTDALRKGKAYLQRTYQAYLDQ